MAVSSTVSKVVRGCALRLAVLLGLASLPAAAQTSTDGQPGLLWTGSLMATVIGPAMEPRLDQQSIDSTVTRYFSNLQSNVRAGRPQENMPLPAETLLNHQPIVLASMYREQIRQSLRAGFFALPVKVVYDQTLRPYYEEQTGLRIQPIGLENDLTRLNPENPLDGITLSDRDLGLYKDLPLARAWSDERDMGLYERIYRDQGRRIVFELDRLLKFDPIPMDIQAAAARGQLPQMQDAILRWEMTITEVRMVDYDVVVSATLDRLWMRWSSDNAPVAEFDVASFPTVASFRQALEDRLPPRATVENVMAPPAGAPFGAEMADLLQLRYLPETVDDRAMQRMMYTRFIYESKLPKGTAPVWGSFFRDFSADPPPERLAEFRAWSEARAAGLPDTLTLVVPLVYNGEQGAQQRLRLPQLRTCEAEPGPNDGGLDGERQMLLKQVCAYLTAAWEQPSEFLFLQEGQKEPQGGGLRGNCGRSDAYCGAIYYARIALKMTDAERPPYDLVHLDRFPVQGDVVRGDRGNLALEVTVRPTAVVAQDAWPETIWHAAQRKVHDFASQYGLGFSLPDTFPPDRPVLVFKVAALSARLVDEETGAPVADLPLVAPVMPPDAMLELAPPSVTHDLLGIRLGMSFDEADAILRAHMDVASVLTADRAKQMGTVGGGIQPYSSGRLYVSAGGNELIAIYDEPPAAAGKVLGMWRVLRLPKGEIDAPRLKATLTQRYGEPSKVAEVDLPMMQKGLAFSWFEVAHERCSVIHTGVQAGLWLDQNGAPWQQPFDIPVLFQGRDLIGFVDVKKQPLPPGSFCPAFLGVRYASPEGRHYADPAGEEIITWLTDNRSYAKAFFESLAAPAALPSAAGAGKSGIKF